MSNRFSIPDWVTTHDFSYTSWKEVPAEKLESIRTGLARFKTDLPTR